MTLGRTLQWGAVAPPASFTTLSIPPFAPMPTVTMLWSFTQETELYSSGQPYAFDAGGKGLDLLRVRSFGERLGWEVTLSSRRCGYIPRASDRCPGRISRCPHCREPEDCYRSGGTVVRLRLREGAAPAALPAGTTAPGGQTPPPSDA